MEDPKVKKYLALLLALVMVFALAACGSTAETPAATEAPAAEPETPAEEPATEADPMEDLIAAAKAEGDSVGGCIECAVTGLPTGLGSPMFDGMENRLARILFGIPAVKGLEFGNGFACAGLRGSENNDPYSMNGGAVRTRTNNAGGILGGLTTGMPLVFRAAIKPTPSIARPQESVSLSRRENTTLEIHGRHDPCIVPRAVPCVEAAAAVAILDALLEEHL